MLRIAIVGSGFGLYGQLPAFNSIKGCRVVAICGRKTERLLNYCESIGLKKIYTNWEKMLNEEKLDAIAIAVHPSMQYEIARRAIENGISVFAEKPLATNFAQAEELLKLAKRKKITHAIDFLFPEIDVWQRAKQLLDNKALGKLKHISVSWDFLSFHIKNNATSWKTDVNEGGGALSFYFSHTLHYLEYFAGEISDIKSNFSYSKESMGKEEVGIDLLLKFKNRISGDAHLSCNSKNLNRHRLSFECEEGKIILENRGYFVNSFILTICEGDENKSFKSNDKTINNEDERVMIVRRLASRFVKACARDEQMAPSFREGLRVQELIEKIREEQE